MSQYKPHPKSSRKLTGRNKNHSPRRGPGASTPGISADGPELLYGQHTVLEALKNPARNNLRLWASENAAKRYASALDGACLDPRIVRTAEITRKTGPEAVHQGLLLEAAPLPSCDLGMIIDRNGPVVVLDQITDPHNVGAVLRSCAAFAAAGLVMTARHSPGASAVLAKAASGALEHVPIARVANLAAAIEALKDAMIACFGLDSEADNALEPLIENETRAALVLGAEGKGLRQRTRTTCSALVRVDMPGMVASLNVSNAAAIALYIADRAAQKKGRSLSRPATPKEASGRIL